MNESGFDKIEYAQFENILVPVPADYEEVLTIGIYRMEDTCKK